MDTVKPHHPTRLRLKYGLDEKLPPVPFLLYSLQWWVVSLPCVIIMGVVLSRLHYQDPSSQAAYVGKVFIVVGATMAVQSLAGHRLPLIAGPASTLLVGLTATVASGPAAQYTAIGVGGAVLAMAGFGGFLAKIRRLFTQRIVVAVLLLIAVTLAPTILRLIVPMEDGYSSFNLGVAVILAFLMLYCNQKLPGVSKSLTVLLGLILGSAVYFAVVTTPSALPMTNIGHRQTEVGFVFDVGTILSFFFCFLALAINEIGSIEALGSLLGADGMDRRMRLGTGLTGVANAAAGCFGVVGPVDFSMSAGLIPASGCASRYPMVPAGLLLAACGFIPGITGFLSSIPGPVMGAILIYLMASQLASGLVLASDTGCAGSFNGGLIIGLPVLLALVIAFAPPAAFLAFPDMIRPIVANGFVVGTMAVVVLEHGIFRKGS